MKDCTNQLHKEKSAADHRCENSQSCDDRNDATLNLKLTNEVCQWLVTMIVC